MTVVAFIPSLSCRGQRLQWLLEREIPRGSLEVHRTTSALSCRLRRCDTSPKLAVLFAERENDLEALAQVRPWLESLRVLLLVPDGHTDTMAEAQWLRPGVIGECAQLLDQIPAILRRMLGDDDVSCILSEEIARNGLTPPKGRGIAGHFVAQPPRFPRSDFFLSNPANALDSISSSRQTQCL